jgi:L-aminopeptidase/D-esterase-like protein
LSRVCGEGGQGHDNDVSALAACGLAVGHATDADGATGCTVVRGISEPFACGVCIPGRASATREVALLEPTQHVDRVDAIFLTGGSAYGLDAAAGVMRWMEQHGRGFPVGVGVVPIVPGAALFDLLPLGRFDARPTAAMAESACEGAIPEFTEGSVGAGTGATVGKIGGAATAMKGGLGAGSVAAGQLVVHAIAVVNALGDVRNGAGDIIAGARDARRAWVDTAAWIADGRNDRTRFGDLAGRSTTLCVVSTNAALGRVQLAALARSSSAALFRRITPVATGFDGDIIFSTAPLSGGIAADLHQVEAMAVQALEIAIERAVRTSAPGDIFHG